MKTRHHPIVANVAAETRFVEEGHHALLLPDGSVKVVSDSTDGRWYEVRFHAGYAGDLVVFHCEPRGRDTYQNGHLDLTGRPGVVPCKHAAGAARRLSREGLIRFEAHGWTATDAAVVPDPVGDPFAGLV